MEIITIIPLNVLINVPNNNNNNNMLSLIFSHNNKNNTNLQFDIILSNEASALESFIQIFGMSRTYFSEKSAIPKKITMKYSTLYVILRDYG
jgi:isocitrate dehydrogenase kinase/phosphatase